MVEKANEHLHGRNTIEVIVVSLINGREQLDAEGLPVFLMVHVIEQPVHLHRFDLDRLKSVEVLAVSVVFVTNLRILGHRILS